VKTPDGNDIWVYDLEVFPNYFLATFFDGAKTWHTFEVMNDKSSFTSLLDFIREEVVLAGFNNFGYDDTVLKWIAQQDGKVTNKSIYELSSRIINGGRNDKGIFKIQYSPAPWAYSLDIFQFLNKRGSLKEWECKEQMPRVVESPCDFTKPLASERVPEIRDYCSVDTRATWRLLKKNWHLVEIRANLVKTYKLSNRAYVVGDAGLAQMVFVQLNQERTGLWITALRENAMQNPDNKAREWPMEKIISDRVHYETKDFKAFLNEFRKTAAKGDKAGTKWKLDPKYKSAITLGSRKYKIGVGGLHTVDKPGVFIAGSRIITDLDVASYYPSLIIQEQLYPKQIGPEFVQNMADLTDARLKAKKDEKAAKKAGDKAAEKHAKGINACSKIILNSTFGKLNDAYSPLRSIPDALRVTVNGQLMLLMLIEQLEIAGFKILSSNTDGVTVDADKTTMKKLPAIMKEWEQTTGHILETAEFTRYCRRDVNAYLALLSNGEVKRKGAFTPWPLTGKWDGVIVKTAAEKFLMNDIPPEKTIEEHTKLMDFLYYQRVKNGGSIYHGKQLVGKIARWYVTHAGEGQPIKRKNPDGSLDGIPNGKSAILALDVRGHDVFGIPKDLSHEYYIGQAWKLINSTKEKSNDHEGQTSDMDEDLEEDQ
jgi:hypothetical protein